MAPVTGACVLCAFILFLKVVTEEAVRMSGLPSDIRTASSVTTFKNLLLKTPLFIQSYYTT